ncbi:MAG: GNAT family N-acetyltransferase [Paracoccaceae bacterium]
MTILVEPGDPRDAQTTALLQGSYALMQSLFPAEENHYLSIDALCSPDIHFFIAREGQDILGTGALAEHRDYGEIKAMFVAPEARGRGVGDAILRKLEDYAMLMGLPNLRLETGASLNAAHRLYRRHGFQVRGHFGEYKANETSLFMEKTL